MSGRLRPAGHQLGHVVAPAAATADMAALRPDTGPEPLLPQATAAAKAGGMVGVRPARPRPQPPVERPPSDRGRGRTPPLRPSAMPSRLRTPAATLPHPPPPAGGWWL